MKYTEFRQKIYDILSNRRYGLSFIMYDENGQITADTDKMYFIYIKKVQVMIKLVTNVPDDTQIVIWKTEKPMRMKFTEILEQIRKTAILNGFSVAPIEEYSTADKSYLQGVVDNIKNELQKKKKMTKMHETVEKSKYSKLVESVNAIYSDRKFSDILGASKKYVEIANLVTECKKQIKECYIDFSKDMLNSIFMSKSEKELKSKLFEGSIVKSEIDFLDEHVNDITNIIRFMTQKDTRHNIALAEGKTQVILENVRIFSKDSEYFFETVNSEIVKSPINDTNYVLLIGNYLDKNGTIYNKAGVNFINECKYNYALRNLLASNRLLESEKKIGRKLLKESSDMLNTFSIEEPHDEKKITEYLKENKEHNWEINVNPIYNHLKATLKHYTRNADLLENCIYNIMNTQMLKEKCVYSDNIQECAKQILGNLKSSDDNVILEAALYNIMNATSEFIPENDKFMGTLKKVLK